MHSLSLWCNQTSTSIRTTRSVGELEVSAKGNTKYNSHTTRIETFILSNDD